MYFSVSSFFAGVTLSTLFTCLLLQAGPVTIPWQAEEAEAGEVAEDSRDPRTAAAACTALLPDIFMAMPLFPFLPEGEAPLSMCDISPGKTSPSMPQQWCIWMLTDLVHCCQSNCVCMSLTLC